MGDVDAGDAASAQLANQLQQRVDLMARQGRGRLVEYQHPRSAGDGACYLHQLLLADAQLPDARRRIQRDMAVREQLRGPGVHLVPIDERAAPGQGADKQVLGDAHFRKQRQFLVDDRDPGVLSIARRAQHGAGTVDKDLTVVTAMGMHAREQLDQRRFAGAVLAAQCVHFTRAQLEVDAVQCRDAAEPFDDISSREHRGARHARRGAHRAAGRAGRSAAGTLR